MDREQFIQKTKELAIDFWTMGLHSGGWESNFRELLYEHENSNMINGKIPIN